MGIYLNPLFWVAIVFAAGVYYLYHKRDSKRKTKSSKPIAVSPSEGEGIPAKYDEPEGSIPVIINDNLMGKWYEAHISEITALAIIKGFQSLGRQWDYGNKKMFSLIRKKLDDGTQVLCPVQISGDIIYSSNEFFSDLQQPEVPMMMKEIIKVDEKSLGDKILEYLPWLVALGFLAFLFAFSK